MTDHETDSVQYYVSPTAVKARLLSKIQFTEEDVQFNVFVDSIDSHVRETIYKYLDMVGVKVVTNVSYFLMDMDTFMVRWGIEMTDDPEDRLGVLPLTVDLYKRRAVSQHPEMDQSPLIIGYGNSLVPKPENDPDDFFYLAPLLYARLKYPINFRYYKKGKLVEEAYTHKDQGPLRRFLSKLK